MRPVSVISTDVQMCHFLPPDSHSDDFDPASTKSKYDSMDFDSCCERPSIAWEGNELHRLAAKRGSRNTSLLFLFFWIQDYKTFYTLSKWMTNLYIHEGIKCISASKVYMNLAAAMLGRDFTCGNSQWSSGHYFSGLTQIRVPLWKRLESSSEFAPHAASPRHFWGEECSSFGLFLLVGVYFLGFFCSFLIWCLDVVLHCWEGFGEKSLGCSR